MYLSFSVYVVLLLKTIKTDNLTAANHDIVSETDNNFNDIQKKSIDNSQNNDVITLDGNYESKGKSIKISKSINIEGSSGGATLNAKGL